MISDVELEAELTFAAAAIARYAEPAFAYEDLLRKEPNGLLSLTRAIGALDGRGLFVALARREALLVEEAQWPHLPEAARAWFDALARLLWAFTATPPASPAAAEVKVVPASATRARDKIFERYAGKAESFEKTGGADLSPGQPISTAEVTIERPTLARVANEQQSEIDARFARAGLKPPIGGDADDARRAAAEVAGALGVAAPPAPRFERVAVKQRWREDDPDTIFISRPATLAAHAPAALRADPQDEGPEQ